MPELDRYNLARAVRDRRWSIPVVALTANAMSEDRQRCIDAGCDDYAMKPIDRIDLLRTCHRWMADVTANDEIFPVQDAPREATVALSPSDAIQNLPSQFECDPMMRELIDDFLHRLKRRVESLHRDRDARNLEHMLVEVHRLKGAAGGCGYPSANA